MVNKHIPIVRERAGAAGATDRRVERTQQALTFALVELVLTKRWAKITVQDLLDRAGVGRSTFYAHYRSKDDLLLKSFVKMLDLMDAQLDRAGAGAGAAPAASRRWPSSSSTSARSRPSTGAGAGARPRAAVPGGRAAHEPAHRAAARDAGRRGGR
jgi:AcrR family transcriptional regulator